MKVILTVDSGEETKDCKVGLVTEFIPRLELGRCCVCRRRNRGTSCDDEIRGWGAFEEGILRGEYLDFP